MEVVLVELGEIGNRKIPEHGAVVFYGPSDTECNTFVTLLQTV